MTSRTLIATHAAILTFTSCAACSTPAPATSCETDVQCGASAYCDPVRHFCVWSGDAAVAVDDATRLDTAIADALRDAAVVDVRHDTGPVDGSHDAAGLDAAVVDGSDAARGDANVDSGTRFVPDLIAVGRYHVCAGKRGGGVKCWGDNFTGQLGYGDTIDRGSGAGEMGSDLPVVDLGSGRTVEALAVGGDHTCAMLTSNEVICWGANGSGQLGVGDTRDRGDDVGEMGDALPTVALGSQQIATLAAGEYFNCVLFEGGQVACWGKNEFGQLGVGDTLPRGDGPGELGDTLARAQLGASFFVNQLTVGPFHACALSTEQTVKCWGDNRYGQLGLGDIVDRGASAASIGANLPLVSLPALFGTVLVQVAAGEDHTCARWADSAVRCWGDNYHGQLGVGDTVARGGGPYEMGDALPATSLGSSIERLTIGEHATCARYLDGSVRCWGYNAYGQLGYGDNHNRGNDLDEMVPTLPLVALGASDATCTMLHTYDHTNCALLAGGKVKCWGYNDQGQLGLGDIDDRGDAPGEMGAQLPPIDLGYE